MSTSRFVLSAVLGALLFGAASAACAQQASSGVTPEQAAADRDGVLAFQRGQDFFSGTHGKPKDHKAAFESFKISAEAGNASGQRFVSDMYADGDGVGVNLDESLRWAALAAKQSRPASAIRQCDKFRANTDSSPANPLFALKFCELLLDTPLRPDLLRGLKPKPWGASTLWAAQNYRDGDIAPQNAEKAVKFYLLSVAARNSRAEVELAQIYTDGKLAPQDYQKARTLFLSAADAGEVQALEGLAALYERGLGGPADLAEAARFYQYAEKLGSSLATQWRIAHADFLSKGMPLNRLDLKNLKAFTIETHDAQGTVTRMDEPDYVQAVLSNAILGSFPERARKANISGVSAVECRITEARRLENCLIVEDSPAGYGFGELQKVIEPLKNWIAPERDLEGNSTVGKLFFLRFNWKSEP